MAVTEARNEAERPPGRPRRKPRRSRYLLVVLLLIGGIAFALGVGFGSSEARSKQAEGFARVRVPGALTFHVDHPATYYVYSELTACLGYPNCHGQLYPVAVRVIGPTEHAVKVELTDGPTYMVGGTEGVGVARFDATAAGDYRVVASTGPYSEGDIAVGEAFPSWTQDWVTWFAMALFGTAAILIVVLPIAMVKRRTRSIVS